MSVEIFSNMIGCVMTSVANIDDGILQFTTVDQERFAFQHDQDCCEHVYIYEIIGDLLDLVGSPIIQAEEVSSEGASPPDSDYESYTWTFYKFATMKGFVTVRWLGVSDGYYSEGVGFKEFTKLNMVQEVMES